MERAAIIAIGVYHVVLVVLFAYLFFVLWPAPWPPPPTATYAQPVAAGTPAATDALAKDKAADAKVAVTKAPETGQSGTAQVAVPAQARADDEVKAPKKYVVKLLWGWFELTASFEQRLILIVLIAGGLGAYIHAASSLADYVGNRKFELSWALWYLLRPFIGMALAIVLYVVFRAGFLSISAASSDVVNVYGITAIAALAGLFSKQAADKLNEIFTTAFRTAQGFGDEGRKDKLVDGAGRLTISAITPATIARGAPPPPLIITGSGFMPGAMCKFNGSDRTTNFKSATEVECVLNAADTLQAGTFEIAVKNPGPGGRSATGRITIQ